MSVFDFSFEKLIGQKVLRVLYFINFILLTSAAMTCSVILYRELADDRPGYVRQALGLLIVLLAYSFLLIFSRVAYESIMIRFQMAEDIRAIRKKFVDNSQV